MAKLDFKHSYIGGVDGGVESDGFMDVRCWVEFGFTPDATCVAGVAILPVCVCTGPASWGKGGCAEVLVFKGCGGVCLECGDGCGGGEVGFGGLSKVVDGGLNREGCCVGAVG